VRLTDDGDYLGAPDRRSGTPLTVALLGERIDGLIAADIDIDMDMNVDVDVDVVCESRGEL
jgi:hypothetical protein